MLSKENGKKGEGREFNQKISESLLR